MDLRLTRTQLRYLLQNHSLPDELVAKLRESLYAPETTVSLTSEQRTKLGDIVAEKLVRNGFDENYHPTSEGEMLESIIDALTHDSQ